MSRQLDIKALVSHIVRGDGGDKCRICMGETSEGQVYLEDTVMMDGERPVTLAELLKSISGVEVLPEDDLPSGLCNICSSSLMAAAEFCLFCQSAMKQWRSVMHLADILPGPEDIGDQKAIYAIVENSHIIIIDSMNEDRDSTVSPMPSELKPKHLPKKSPIKTKRRRGIRKPCQCPDCGKKFVCIQHLSQHFMESTDYKRSCHICAAIMQRDELIKHLRRVHETKPYDCKKCPALFPSMKPFQQHLLKAHSPGAISCGDCGRSFQTDNAFYGHLTMHNAKNCPCCDKLFRNHRCYLYHIKGCCNLDKNRQDVHRTKTGVRFEVKNNKSEKKIKVGVRGSSEKECVCDYCGKTFAGKKFVCAHIQIVHMKNTHRPCPYCGKLLAAAHMTVHLKKHEEITVFKCEHCGITLRTKLCYIQHLRLHTGEKPYTCSYCSETFSASSRRSEHVRKMHKSSDQKLLKHACEFCPARFRLPYRLKKHMTAVHGEQQDDNKVEFKCPDCHIKFGSCRGLLHHSRQHQTLNRPLKTRSQTK